MDIKSERHQLGAPLAYDLQVNPFRCLGEQAVHGATHSRKPSADFALPPFSLSLFFSLIFSSSFVSLKDTIHDNMSVMI